MGKRPLLVALVIVAAGLLLQHYRQSLQSVPAYDGVEKSLECQVEDISGQGETLSVTARDVTEHKNFSAPVSNYIPGKTGLFFQI